VRVATTPYHSARTTVTTEPRHFLEQKRGELVQSRSDTSARRGGAYKRLYDAEYHEKLRRGFCFRCDEKYDPNHRCNSKQLNLLIVAVEDREEGDIEEHSDELINTGMDHLNVQEQQESPKLMELSLYSIAGFTSKKSLKVWGTILGKKVIMLIDVEHQ